MNAHTKTIARSVKTVALPLLLASASLLGTAAVAGGNSSGQPSGSTIGGSSSTPTPVMSGMTSVIVGGSGPTVVSSTVVPPGGSAPVVMRTVTLPAVTVSTSLSIVGLSLPSPGSFSVLAGSSGTYTITSQGGSVSVSFTPFSPGS